MKRQRLSILSIFALLIVFVACDDTLKQVGFTVQPEKDKLAISTDSMLLSARTVEVDSVFSRTKYPVLGEYSDPIFGSIKSEYMGEFFYTEESSFKEGATVDSVRLTVSYATLIGDSLTPMRLSVYNLEKSIPKNKDYTNINPKKFADMSSPIGSTLFTGKNETYHTEVHGSGNYMQKITVYDIHVPLPKALGESFLEEYQKPNHGFFESADVFRKKFPGMYITTSFGNSTIMKINITSLYVHYHYLDKGGSSQKTDTIRTAAFRLNMTPEVTQINYIESNNEKLLIPNDEKAYVKSPVGVNTEVTFPVSTIHERLKKQALSQAKLVVYALPEGNENSNVKIAPPAHLLLINKDSLSGFFEKRKRPDNVTSYIAEFNKLTYSYDFKNISAMINYYKEQNKDKTSNEYQPFDLTYYLVPVDVTFAAGQGGQQSNIPIAVYNQMQPGAAIIDKRPQNLKLDMIFSHF